MGNGITKNPCFSKDTYAVALPSDPVPNDNHGHSFTYVPTAAATGKSPTFSLSGAAISANQVTSSSMPSFRTVNDMTWPQSSACTFESSRSFAAAPLQTTPTRSPMSGRLLSMSGRFSDTSGAASTISNRLSGTLDRSFSSSSSFVSHQANASHLMAERGDTRSGRCNERPLSRFFARAASRLQLGAPRYALLSEGPSEAPNMESFDGEDRLAPPNDNVQWAQGMVGEDRFHVAVSEEHGWVFVGIYDGFNGPDAADYLMANLYVALHRELTTATTVDSPEFARKPAKRGRTERAEKDKAATSGGGTAMHHDEVLGAMAAALRKTEEAFFAASERWADESPELGLMGSCVLVMLMKGADVYVMSVGDSRAVLAARRELDLDIILGVGGLRCVQLNDEHSTADAKEEMRVRDQHSDDPNAIVRGRVKGKLNLTRAFGAGYLKQPKWNSRLLAAFKIDYIGLEPYISCNPSLRHHRIGPNDKFLVLSSDGLYQYFTNEEVVDHVQMFMAAYPDGDPAQHLVAELVVRAARKAGMHCHELLEIGHGGRRKYHDDVSIVVISFKGRIWRSSV